MTKDMDPTIAALVLVGSIFFPLTFLTSAFLLRKWTGIPSLVVQTELAMRLTSILQSIMASGCGCYIVVHCCHDFLYARCWLVDAYISFGVPYMIYDIGAMYSAYHKDVEARTGTIIPKHSTFLPFLKRRKMIVLHHILVAFVGYPIALFYRNDKGDFFIGCLFLTELSSPFVNLRAILKKVNRADSQLYQMNSALILLVFFICRILIFPILFWVYSWDKPVRWFGVPMVIPWHCTLGCSVIASFQLLWYVMFAQSFWRQWKGKVVDANSNLSNGVSRVAKLE